MYERAILTAAVITVAVLLTVGASGTISANTAPVTAPSPMMEIATTPPASLAPTPPTVQPVVLDATLASTFAITPYAPRWVWDGTTASIPSRVATVLGKTSIPVLDAPGGSQVATLPIEQLSDGTTLPVVGKQAGWVRILLPSRLAKPSAGGPVNGASGWVPASVVTVTSTPWLITVDLTKRTLTVVRDGAVLRTLHVGVGAPGTPTPDGLAWVLSRFTDPAQGMGMPILALGVHSAALSSFGDGDPATVAIHANPVHSGAVSHGCIRLDPADLPLLAGIPIGTPILITNGVT